MKESADRQLKKMKTIRQISKEIDLFKRAPIPKVAEGLDRPLWSVMIPSFNRPDYLERTLKSVMVAAQDPTRMQIEVVENGPINPETANVVARVGQGRILHYPQPKPVTWIENWNTCISRSRGVWVHLLHDDDFVMPEFYIAYESMIRKTGCKMISGQIVFMDDEDRWIGVSALQPLREGTWLDYEEVVWRLNPFPVCSTVVSREIYELAGGFSHELKSMLDWDQWRNCARHTDVAWMPRPYSCYRIPPAATMVNPVRHTLALDEMNEIERRFSLEPTIDSALRKRLFRDLRIFRKDYLENMIMARIRRREYVQACRYLFQYLFWTPFVPGGFLGLLLRALTVAYRG